MELIDIVRKLVGPILPTGESSGDEKRFENLRVMTKLADIIIGDIDGVITYKNSLAFSEKRAGEFASKFFDDLGIKE